MNKNQIIAGGIYEYSLPGWNRTVFVSVFESDGEKFVKFNGMQYSTKLEDIPDNAVFAKWI